MRKGNLMSTSDNGKAALKTAWMWTALIPVGYFAAVALGEVIYSALGGTDTSGSFLVKAGASIPAFALMLLAPLQATLIGRKAFMQGAKNGRVPSVIGIVVLIFISTIGLASIFMSV